MLREIVLPMFHTCSTFERPSPGTRGTQISSVRFQLVTKCRWMIGTAQLEIASEAEALG
jgi:hypothetical protein